MDVSALKNQIKSNTFSKILIFSGPEWEVQKIYISQISKITGLETKRIDTISDAVRKFKSISFVQKNYIYIARDDIEYMQNEKLQKFVKDAIGKNMFILLLTSLDKRLKFYKTYKDSIIEFESLKPAILKKYVHNACLALDDECLDKLIEICENDYGRCLLELDKLKKFIAGNKDDHRDLYADKIESYTHYCFNLLLNDGTFYQPPKDAIFDFVDAILDRKIKCFDLFEQCKVVGEATLVMISVLYNNAKAVLQVQSCQSKDISKSTGLSNWQIMNAKKHVGKYSNHELLDIMRGCTEAEQGIKTGKIDEEFAVEHLLVNVL